MHLIILIRTNWNYVLVSIISIRMSYKIIIPIMAPKLNRNIDNSQNSLYIHNSVMETRCEHISVMNILAFLPKIFHLHNGAHAKWMLIRKWNGAPNFHTLNYSWSSYYRYYIWVIVGLVVYHLTQMRISSSRTISKICANWTSDIFQNVRTFGKIWLSSINFE